jgi:FAD/FMN-containing dehydrogenase
MQALIARLTAVLGADAVLTGEAISDRYHSPWTNLGAPLAVLLPRSTEAVAAILREASTAGASVVPWGGRSGLVDGCAATGALALSLEHMTAIEEIDAAAGTMTVQAGCILQNACEAAERENLFLPLDLGARGMATIGGNIATNAGGNRVLRYGMMRDTVLGVEAVLADGTVISAMSPLLKDNAGYDLKQLFIGSEGTLGVVTRAVLRLRPAPASQDTAILGVERFSALPALLRRLERNLGGALSAFEVMWPSFYDLVTTEPARGRSPLAARHAYYVLVEALGPEPDRDAERFQAVLAEALESGEVADAAIATSKAQREAMWALRDDVFQTARNGLVAAFDVSLPIGAMEDYVAGVCEAFAARWPDLGPPAVFGHLGDGNLHLVARLADFEPRTRRAVEEMIYGPLAPIGGSVSAEHGVGLQKRDFLHLTRSAEEIALMRRLKQALDPTSVLNPGKVFPLPVPG